MKAKVFAVAMLFLTVGFVIFNTYKLQRDIGYIKGEVVAVDGLDSAKSAYESFKKKETYISLTVNHADMTSIEESFSELIGYYEVGDMDGAHVTKNRLTDALEHLGRLSGFNIDAII